eukprot:8934326-Heterocapsa_arctica.AAC.1
MRCAPHALTLEIQLGVGPALLPCERSCVHGLGLLMFCFGAVSASLWVHCLLGGQSSRCRLAAPWSGAIHCHCVNGWAAPGLKAPGSGRCHGATSGRSGW